MSVYLSLAKILLALVIVCLPIGVILLPAFAFIGYLKGWF